ncbi:MAG: hypothetical protein U1A78_18700 [Polyangia bacterium]
MTKGPGSRAVVFALRDLPAADQQYIAAAASALGIPLAADTRLWDTPLLLTRLGHAPPVPGLRGDDELRAQGLSPLLLALRLLTVDALFWPELRFLGLDPRSDALDYIVYAADPQRWTVDSLVQALQPAAEGDRRGGARYGIGACHVQRGLGERPPRLPPCPGDRVPVLGWQVPLLGGRLANLIDLREPGMKQHKAGDFVVHAGMQPGHAQGCYALFLQLRGVSGLRAELELLRTDRQSGTMWSGTLDVELGEEGLERLAASCGLSEHELRSDDEELATWLELVLPRCLLCAPAGELLLVDLFGLDLSASPLRGTTPAPPLRICGRPALYEHPPLAALPEAPDPTDLLLDPHLLDPSLWPLDVLADAIDLQSAWVSPSGRLLRLHLAGWHDGEPLSGVVLLDLNASAGTGLLASLLDDDELAGPSPERARTPDDSDLPALHTTQHALRT